MVLWAEEHSMWEITESGEFCELRLTWILFSTLGQPGRCSWYSLCNIRTHIRCYFGQQFHSPPIDTHLLWTALDHTYRPHSGRLGNKSSSISANPFVQHSQSSMSKDTSLIDSFPFSSYLDSNYIPSDEEVVEIKHFLIQPREQLE